MFKNLVSYVGLSQQPGILPLLKVKIAENKFGKTWKQKVLQEKHFLFVAYIPQVTNNTSH
jgi:hypothetical protein